jgi:hypothetical protein
VRPAQPTRIVNISSTKEQFSVTVNTLQIQQSNQVATRLRKLVIKQVSVTAFPTIVPRRCSLVVFVRVCPVGRLAYIVPDQMVSS